MLLLLAATAAAIGYQGCSKVNQSSSSAGGVTESRENLIGGTGVDGKAYLAYGDCADNRAGLKTKLIRKFGKSTLVRENCQELPTPKSVAETDMEFSSDARILVLDKKNILDQQAEAGAQMVTVAYCRSAEVQSAVWQDVGDPDSYFGSVSLKSGGTGTLEVDPPSSGEPARFHSVTSSGGARFDLDAASGSLSYSLAGRPAITIAGLTCVRQSVPGYIDGSSGAPRTPAQHPGWLNGYAARAPWRVAGVDYGVGYSSTSTLKDPLKDSALAANRAVQIDTIRKIIIVDGDNIVLDGYDFTLNGGYDITFSSGRGLIVSNSRVHLIQSRTLSSNLTVRNCVFDGLSGLASDWAFISHQGKGTLTVEYNWFKNFPQDVVKDIGSGGLVFRYNVMEAGGLRAGNSSSFLYMAVGPVNPVTIAYNTTYQPVEVSLNKGFLFNPDGSGAMVSGEIAYNTMISLGSAGRRSMDYLMEVGDRVSPVTAAVHDNFMDLSGAAGAFAPGRNGDGKTVAVYNDNMSMIDGSYLTTNP